MKVGIYTGSFNPVHIGHLALANYLCEFEGLDEVWFMVSPQNPLKERDTLLDDARRLEMARTALEGETRLKACDYVSQVPGIRFRVSSFAPFLHRAYVGSLAANLSGA